MQSDFEGLTSSIMFIPFTFPKIAKKIEVRKYHRKDQGLLELKNDINPNDNKVELLQNY